MRIDTMTAARLAALFDHTLLRPECTASDFQKHIDECKQFHFYSAATHSGHVAEYACALQGSDILVGAAIGFPFGQAAARAKEAEARIALEDGAQEIDYVLNIGKLLDGSLSYIEDEMALILAQCRRHGAVCKVILENCYLTQQAKIAACEIAVKTGIDYVKTSTGFGPGGATVEDIRLMKQIVGDKVRVKASGGMRTLANAAAAIEAGADRLGSAFSVSILEEFQHQYS